MNKAEKESVRAIAILFIGVGSSVRGTGVLPVFTRKMRVPHSTNSFAATSKNEQLFKLFLEIIKLPAQTFDFRREGLNPVFETNDFFGFD